MIAHAAQTVVCSELYWQVWIIIITQKKIVAQEKQLMLRTKYTRALSKSQRKNATQRGSCDVRLSVSSIRYFLYRQMISKYFLVAELPKITSNGLLPDTGQIYLDILTKLALLVPQLS